MGNKRKRPPKLTDGGAHDDGTVHYEHGPGGWFCCGIDYPDNVFWCTKCRQLKAV